MEHQKMGTVKESADRSSRTHDAFQLTILLYDISMNAKNRELKSDLREIQVPTDLPDMREVFRYCVEQLSLFDLKEIVTNLVTDISKLTRDRLKAIRNFVFHDIPSPEIHNDNELKDISLYLRTIITRNHLNDVSDLCEYYEQKKRRVKYYLKDHFEVEKQNDEYSHAKTKEIRLILSPVTFAYFQREAKGDIFNTLLSSVHCDAEPDLVTFLSSAWSSENNRRCLMETLNYVSFKSSRHHMSVKGGMPITGGIGLTWDELLQNEAIDLMPGCQIIVNSFMPGFGFHKSEGVTNELSFLDKRFKPPLAKEERGGNSESGLSHLVEKAKQKLLSYIKVKKKEAGTCQTETEMAELPEESSFPYIATEAINSL
jgi:hypothetical protein